MFFVEKLCCGCCVQGCEYWGCWHQRHYSHCCHGMTTTSMCHKRHDDNDDHYNTHARTLLSLVLCSPAQAFCTVEKHQCHANLLYKGRRKALDSGYSTTVVMSTWIYYEMWRVCKTCSRSQDTWQPIILSHHFANNQHQHHLLVLTFR